MAQFLSGAECGPANALKSVSGRLDIDRSLHRDRFTSQQGIAGPSRSTFGPNGPISSTTQSHSQSPSPSPFNLDDLRRHISSPPVPLQQQTALSPLQDRWSQPQHQAHSHLVPAQSDWANSFVARPASQSQHVDSRARHGSAGWGDDFARQDQASRLDPQRSVGSTGGMAPWERPIGVQPAYRPVQPSYSPSQMFGPPQPIFATFPAQPHQAQVIPDSVHTQSYSPQNQLDRPDTTRQDAESSRQPGPLTDSQEVLANTAADFMTQLKSDGTNLMEDPKFANSQFMQLVSALGHRKVVAEEGNPSIKVGQGDVSEGAKFVARQGGTEAGWAGDFMAQTQASAGPSTSILSGTPIHRTFGHYTSLQRAPGLNSPTTQLPLQATNQVSQSDWDQQFMDQDAIIQRSNPQRRKSVHFEQSTDVPAMGRGVPNTLEEALSNTSAIPGANFAWEDQAMDSFDFDEETFYGFNGPMSIATDPRLGVAAMEGWKGMEEDWAEFQHRAKLSNTSQDRYLFQAKNPYTSQDMEQGSPTVKGVLELESEVQKDPSSWEAWYALGLKQQENEREDQAILALSKVIQLEPDHQETYLALAVSYTNEGQKEAANSMLERWLDLGMEERRDGEDRGGTYEERRRRIIERLIGLARESPEELDPEVQIALGVMFNASEEYEKAEDCFSAALSVRPDDWLLYNRLGATLANSGRSEEAIELYHKALFLHPNFVRALFNLGVSYINLGQYAQAAQSVLDALRLQHADATEGYASAHLKTTSAKGVTSQTLWNTLRNACLHMGRQDLVALTGRRDLSAFPSSFIEGTSTEESHQVEAEM